MSSDTQQIALIKSQTLAQIVDLTANPKPTYQLDGQMVSWNRYLEILEHTVAWCDLQLAAAEPFEVRSQGYTD